VFAGVVFFLHVSAPNAVLLRSLDFVLTGDKNCGYLSPTALGSFAYIKLQRNC